MAIERLMMYRSRLILLAVLVLGASLVFMQAASAVGMREGGACPMVSMDKLTKALNLTPDQVSKIQAIHEDAKTQMQAIVADKSLTADARKAKLTELRESTRSQIMAVLTPDQQAKWKELAAARKTEGFDRMSKMLGLTPDQRAQIKSIKDTEKADIQAVRDDQTLSADAKLARVKEIRAAARDKFMAVLTPEQRAKLEAAHKRMGGEKSESY
jgi:Spy/CpxP family protein refolding chaperone